MDFKGLINFLKAVDKNNNKDWFDANRPVYEALRKEWIVFLDNLISELQKIDAGLNGLEAKACIFRINKDVRFSKDKSPYKTNFGALMNRGGKKSNYAGYYLHIDPKEIFIAGGSYQPSPELLASVRQEIDYNLDEWKEIVENRQVLKHFGGLSGASLVRPPKGYEIDNPAIEYLKRKNFVYMQQFEVADLYSEKFLKSILEAYAAMKPMNDFINRCVD